MASASSVSAAYSCDAVNALTGAQATQVATFCRTYMGMVPITTTATQTSTKATRWITQGALTTTTTQILPAASTSTSTTKVTTLTTTTPASRATTQYVTSTAYVDPDGDTMVVMKRAEPTDGPQLEARARLPTPALFVGMRSAEVKFNCRCLALPKVTITRTVTKAVFATSTKVLPRKLIKTTTLPVPIVAAIKTNMLTKIVTAPAPAAVTQIVVFEDVHSCPPDQPQTDYVCPAGTADDDESDPNYNNCGVTALDNFEGYCLYWQDDGSAVESVLRRGSDTDPGNPDSDDLRYATYGDGDEDDCPLYADYTCTATKKRSLFSTHDKRSYTGAKATDHHKFIETVARKPGHGHYIPQAIYQAKIAASRAALLAAGN